MAGLKIRPIKYQTIEIDTTSTNFVAATGLGSFSLETDRLYKKLKGITVALITLAGAPNTELVKFRKAEIQGREIYPDGFYIKNITTSADVPLNKKFDLEIDEEAAGNKVDIIFQDANYVAGNEYKFLVTLKLSNEEHDTTREGKVPGWFKTFSDFVTTKFNDLQAKLDSLKK